LADQAVPYLSGSFVTVFC